MASNPYLGEIRMFGGNFAPRGWALCNGQILSIAQNTALFSLLGTTFGGNGTSNFGLPNLQGSTPIGFGQGPGLALRDMGEVGGTSTVTLTVNELAAHAHTPSALSTSPNPAPVLSPAGAVWAVAGSRRVTTNLYKAAPPGAAANLNFAAVGLSGNGVPHNNMQPYLAVTFIIAMSGVFPARN